MPLGIIFAGTPEFAASSLKALIESNHHIIAVYTQPDRPAGRGLKLTPSDVKILAQAHHIPIYQPKSLRDLKEQEILKSLNPDLMVVAAYGLLLPKAVLEIPRLGCINVHASLLPRWRGAAPIQRAIIAGDQQTGITLMQMDHGLDTGAMLATRSCEIAKTQTAGELHDQLAKIGAQLLIELLPSIEHSKIQPKIQNEALATYAAKIQKDEAEIRWNKSAQQLVNEIRAFNPWPGAFTHYQGERLKIWRAHIADGTTDLTPGTLIHVSRQELQIATGQGILSLQEVQMAGGRVINIVDFIHAQQRNLIAEVTIFG